MGELLHPLREGTAAGGPSEGPGNERLEGDNPEGSQDPPVGLRPALRQAVQAGSSRGQE